MLDIAFDFSEVISHLEKTKEFIEKEAPLAIGNLIAKQIKTLTYSGRDATGATFAPYTLKYAEYRKKHGKQADTVNLTFSGKLLANLGVTQDGNTTFVGPDGDLNEKIAEGLSQKRTFIGIHPDTIRNAQDVIVNMYRNMVQ